MNSIFAIWVPDFTYSWVEKQINVIQWICIITDQMQIYAQKNPKNNTLCYISLRNKVAKVAIDNKQKTALSFISLVILPAFLIYCFICGIKCTKFSNIYYPWENTQYIKCRNILHIKAHTVLNLEAWELQLCASPPSPFHYLKECGEVSSWHGSIITLPVHYQRWMLEIWGGKYRLWEYGGERWWLQVFHDGW